MLVESKAHQFSEVLEDDLKKNCSSGGLVNEMDYFYILKVIFNLEVFFFLFYRVFFFLKLSPF